MKNLEGIPNQGNQNQRHPTRVVFEKRSNVYGKPSCAKVTSGLPLLTYPKIFTHLQMVVSPMVFGFP